MNKIQIKNNTTPIEIPINYYKKPSKYNDFLKELEQPQITSEVV